MDLRISKSRLQTLRTLAEKAVTGPWRIGPESAAQRESLTDFQMAMQGRCVLYASRNESDWIADLAVSVQPEGRIAAAYIASASPDVMLALLDEIQRLSLPG